MTNVYAELTRASDALLTAQENSQASQTQLDDAWIQYRLAYKAYFEAMNQGKGNA